MSLPDPLNQDVARITKTGLNVDELIEEFEKQGEEPGLFAVSRVVDMPGFYEEEASAQFTPSQVHESDYDEEEEPNFLQSMEKNLARKVVTHSSSVKAIRPSVLVRKHSSFRKARRLTA